MELTDGKILKKAIDLSDYKIEEVIEKTGISRGQLYNLFRETTIKQEYKERIAKLKLNIDFEEKSTKSTINKGKLNMIIVPLKAVGGFLMGYENKAYMDSLERVEFPDVKGECFRFEVEGFSMYLSKVIEGEIFEVGYKPGTHVVATKVENIDWVSKNKDYVFQTTDGLIIKKFDKIKDGKYHLSSINKEYNPVPPIPANSVKGIYFIEKKIM